MSLNWTVKNVADYETVCFEESKYDDPTYGIKVGDRIVHWVTNALIWRLPAIGIGTITEKNVGEVYARLRFLSRLDGEPLRQQVDGEWITRDFTVEEIRRHVGLSTNVTFERQPAWIKRIVEPTLRDEERCFYSEAAKLEREVAVPV